MRVSVLVSLALTLAWGPGCSDEPEGSGPTSTPDADFPTGDATGDPSDGPGALDGAVDEDGASGTDGPGGGGDGATAGDGDQGDGQGDTDGGATSDGQGGDGGTDGDPGGDGKAGDVGAETDDACVADCAGKACGDDQCGGTCGDCAGGTACVDSQCQDIDDPLPTCGQEGHFAYTNAGCDFYALDLRNAQVSQGGAFMDAQNQPFAVIVSNTSVSWPVTVTLTDPAGGTEEIELPGSSLHVFTLPATWGLEGTQKSQSAYRISSTGHIVAYQFNPLDNVDVFSNDASVLLPPNELPDEFFVMTLQHFHPGGTDYEFPGSVTIVGAGDGPVEVTVTATANIGGGGGVDGFGPGVPVVFSLEPGEVLNLEETAGDMTGTHVMANGAVVIFSGHVAGRPENNVCCSDHLEQQMPPVSSWGHEISMGRSMERDMEKDHYRVLASRDGTVVQIHTDIPVMEKTLDKGDFFSFESDTHVTVVGSQPILLAQFLASAQEVVKEGPCDSVADCGQAYECKPFSDQSTVDVCLLKGCGPPNTPDPCGPGYTCSESPYDAPGVFTCHAIGDPTMILGVPKAQWQDRFVFLTPGFYVKDYINVVGSPNMTLVLDGDPIDPTLYEFMNGTDHVAFRTEVGDGTHTLEANEPVSLVVYGYDHSVSYGYPGAMGLKDLGFE